MLAVGVSAPLVGAHEGAGAVAGLDVGYDGLEAFEFVFAFEGGKAQMRGWRIARRPSPQPSPPRGEGDHWLAQARPMQECYPQARDGPR